MNMQELVDIVDSHIFKSNPTGFVCTPETFRRICAVGDMTARPYLSPYQWVGSAVGVPVRVEVDPDPQQGELLLELT